MRMNQDEIRFDFHGLGLAIKQAREERGWTQAYVVELVGKTASTIMNIENKGQLQFIFQTRYHVRYFRRPVFLPGRTAGRTQLQKAHYVSFQYYLHC